MAFTHGSVMVLLNNLWPGDMAIMMLQIVMQQKWHEWWKNEQTQGDSDQDRDDATMLSRVLVMAKVLGCGWLESQRLTDCRWQNMPFYRFFGGGLLRMCNMLLTDSRWVLNPFCGDATEKQLGFFKGKPTTNINNCNVHWLFSFKIQEILQIPLNPFPCAEPPWESHNKLQKLMKLVKRSF